MTRYPFPILSLFLLCLLLGFGCERENSWKTESGLEVIEIVEGEGRTPSDGDIVSIHYTGWYVGGEEFDNTEKLGKPRKFRIGRKQLLPGLAEGVASMRVGGKRILILPPHLAYGEEGRPGVVPPHTWVKFEVELVDIEIGPPDPLPWNDAGMEIIVTDSGLQIVDFVVGEGELPVLGDYVVVHYSGFLADGTLFDTTYLRGRPVEFELDAERLIHGWLEGLLSMRAGGARKLIIPPFLGYGEKGFGERVPPNATLIYDIELLEISKPSAVQ
jgi:FKBP-type peptidyl-prolyl cis-trans isomerase